VVRGGTGGKQRDGRGERQPDGGEKENDRHDRVSVVRDEADYIHAAKNSLRLSLDAIGWGMSRAGWIIPGRTLRALQGALRES
jgi:hypothetical protein